MQNPMTKRVARAYNAAIKRIKGKSIPLAVPIFWTPGNKEVRYCQDFSVTRCAALNTPINIVEDFALKCIKNLEDTIMLNKPARKSTFYIRSNLQLEWHDMPESFSSKYTCFISGAWDRPGLLRKPRESVVGKMFQKKLTYNALPSEVLKLPTNIKVNSSRGMKWAKNGRLIRKSYVAENLDNHNHICYLTNYTLRKYYYEMIYVKSTLVKI